MGILGEPELAKYIVTQGGLAVVCLVMFFVMRRDYAKRAADDREARGMLITLVKENTSAMTSQAGAAEHVARALELLQLHR